MEKLNVIEQTCRQLTQEGKKIIKLFSGNPNEHGFHFPKEILEEGYQRYFSKQDYHPHPKGLLQAREAIRDYYQEKVTAENLILTSGTSESFSYLFSLLTHPGDNILTPIPAYPLFDYVAALTHVELRHYSLREDKNWEVDIEEIKSRTNSRTRAIILVSPNNPTGSVISAHQILEITEWANQKGIALICDEVFSEFYFGEGQFPRPLAVAQPNLCFTLNGISKMFALPGLKLSWIAVTGKKDTVDSAVDRLETIADTFLSCHIPIQETLPRLFSEGGHFLKIYHREVEKRRNLAVELLNQCPGLKFSKPIGGFYLMFEITKNGGLTEDDFVIQLMREKGVFIHPGYFYDYEEGLHGVISYLSRESELQTGLVRLAEFIQSR